MDEAQWAEQRLYAREVVELRGSGSCDVSMIVLLPAAAQHICLASADADLRPDTAIAAVPLQVFEISKHDARSLFETTEIWAETENIF